MESGATRTRRSDRSVVPGPTRRVNGSALVHPGTPARALPSLLERADARINQWMTDLLTESLRVIASLNAHGVEYAVVGGMAMNLHGLIRATEDLDLFVRADPSNIGRLRSALQQVWDDPSIDEIRDEDLCGDYPAVRYGPPEGSLYIDILARLGERVRFEQIDIEEVDIEGVRVRVATPAALRWMKRETGRPIDEADAAILSRVFDLEDE